MKILLVDDHELVREGIKFLLREIEPGIELDDADNCDKALSLASAQRYDLVLLDLKMPGVQGLDALSIFREQHEDQPIVILSGEDAPDTVRAAIDSGCMGFIPKTSSRNVFEHALRLVLAGGVYLPPAALGSRSARDETTDASREIPASAVSGLSGRQLEVLKFVIEGKPNKIIARELDISENTVKAHLSSIFRALGVHNRTEAVYEAAKLGMPLD